ncbi:hypothetical protein HG531_008474 [Fusarium graminearum]|nr:hypothetical protein HG531_008474 [Fusarium graminearum]
MAALKGIKWYSRLSPGDAKRCAEGKLLKLIVPVCNTTDIIDTTAQDIGGDALVSDESLDGLVKGVVDDDSAGVEHLAGLVLEGHARHQVIDTLVDAESLVAVGRVGILSDDWVGDAHRDTSQEEETGPHGEV